MARLSKEDWLRGALDVLAEEGLAAVAVEPLARQLGVTKGSFYWHFKDRSALLEAMLEEWEQRETLAVIEWLQAMPDPRMRLTRLLKLALEDQTSTRHYLALAASVHEPHVLQALQRVSARRVDYMAECFRGLGYPDAVQRAHIAYAAYIGSMHLARDLVQFPPGYAQGLLDVVVG